MRSNPPKLTSERGPRGRGTPGQVASWPRKRKAQKARASRLQAQADELKIPLPALMKRLRSEFEAAHQNRRRVNLTPVDDNRLRY
jgi:hypothetical protein